MTMKSEIIFSEIRKTKMRSEDRKEIILHENNLFDHLCTGRSIQNAIICWLLNFFNYPDTDLYYISARLLEMTGISYKTGMKALRTIQDYVDADIIISIPEINRVVIVEDEASVYEDPDIFSKTKKKLMESSPNETFELLGVRGPLHDDEITTAVLNSGNTRSGSPYIMREVNRVVTSNMLIDTLQPFCGKSEILDAYVWHLKNNRSKRAGV